MNVCDFTCLMPGENAAAVSVVGLEYGAAVSINRSEDLSQTIRFNGGGCVYSIALEAATSISPFEYCLRVDAQGPGGRTSGGGYLYFMDVSGDTYSLEVFSSKRKEHTLRYNSRRPQIIAIVWSNKSK